MAVKGSILTTGQILLVGDYLVSENGLFYAIMQGDGNFCVYRGTGPSDNKGGVWCARNASLPTGPYFAIIQADGNFCVYQGSGPNDNKGGVWCSNNASLPKGEYVAVMQKDGNFSTYKGYGLNWLEKSVWNALADTTALACPEAYAAYQAAEANVTRLTGEVQTAMATKDDSLKSLQTQLNSAQADAFTKQQAFEYCHSQNLPPSLTLAAPQRILETDVVNPPHPSGANGPDDPTWNQQFIKHLTIPIPFDEQHFDGFPFFGKEWTQVLAPDEEYDTPVVGVPGWVVNPRYATGDFPFDHPWGPASPDEKQWDWEFEIAVDPDPKYQGLLGAGNKGSPDGTSDAIDEFANEGIASSLIPKLSNQPLQTPGGLLGVEWEMNLVPETFRNNVNEGDRIVAFGRWIVDCGHSIARTEIHPPLLLACASPIDPDTTRVIFTSRPYLAGQTYTNDLGSIYVDGTNDDGDFMSHYLKQIAEVNVLASKIVECHPKIKSRPFTGTPTARFIIRPSNSSTTKKGAASTSVLGVSFQFTVRTGVSVDISHPEPDRIDVVVTLDSTAYIPPPLPNVNHSRLYSPDELEKLNSSVHTGLDVTEGGSAALQLFANPAGLVTAPYVYHVLSKGILTDCYEAVGGNVNVLDATHSATNQLGVNGPGVIVNDIQPFPIFGWIQVGWFEGPLNAHV